MHDNKRCLLRFCRLYFLFCFFSSGIYANTSNNWLVGAGIADVTGPAAENALNGYAHPSQLSEGIHIRQRARAFIVAQNQTGGARVVFVSVDTGLMFHSVVQGVVAELQTEFGELYTDRNIVLSATHTHSASGGHSHYALSNIPFFGFVQQSLDSHVSGIVKAIKNAHRNLRPGEVFHGKGDLKGVNRNRSIEAFNNNDDQLKSKFTDAVDSEMNVLKFTQGDKDIGMISWFPVHPVSMTAGNHFLSGDHKGYASLKLELGRGLNYKTQEGYVAAFAQGASGDMTSNINLDGTGAGRTEVESTEFAGEQQYQKALEILNGPMTKLSGSIDYKHRYIQMDQVQIDAKYTEGHGAATTCPGALGVGFAAGTEDGLGPLQAIFQEGVIDWHPFLQGVADVVNGTSEELKLCQSPKPIFLAVGKAIPYPWVNEILPMSILKIGQINIIAIPGEMTIAAGLQLREAVTREVGGSSVIAGLSNAYSHYVATYNEYQKQHYEGGSTLFGPHTHHAYLQEFSLLAKALKQDQDVHDKWAPPRKLTDEQIHSIRPGVIFDEVPDGKDFGDIDERPKSKYFSGETVFTSFWTGHPKNNLRSNKSFLEVQRRVDGLDGSHWVTIADDSDWYTKYRWQRIGSILSAESIAQITWKINKDVSSGWYRIVHYGDAKKSSQSNSITSFMGVTPAFYVEPPIEEDKWSVDQVIVGIKSLKNEKYMTQTPNGEIVLLSSYPESSARYYMVFIKPKLVAFRTVHDQKFLTVNDTRLEKSIRNQEINSRDIFALVDLKDNKVAFRSVATGLFLRAKGKKLLANGKKVRDASTFLRSYL